MPKQPIPPDVVQPVDERIVRWARRCVRACIRARSKEDAEAALEPIWERSERSARFADSAFVAIQRLRDIGVLYDDEGACLLNEIYEYRSEYYARHDRKHRRMIQESLEDMNAGPSARHDEEWHMKRLIRRDEEMKAAFLRARGELTLAERVLAGDESLANDIYEGEVSLVLEKVPYPAIEPVDPQWVALLRERIAGLINAETHAETAERHLHLHDLFSESTPASGVEAARQLREVGVITREQMFLLIDAAIEGLVNEAIVADRVASRLERKRELGEPTEFEEQVYMRRYYQLRAYYLRRLGEHEMAELLRRDPEEYQRIIDEAPPSEWMASLLRNAGL
jgi:hypothetical protein